MGAEEDARGDFRTETRDDVAGVERSAVPSLHVSVLSLNGHAVGGKLLHYPLATQVVGT